MKASLNTWTRDHLKIVNCVLKFSAQRLYLSFATSMSTLNKDLETPPAELPQRPPSIDRGPQRPAPTQAYDFKDCNPHGQVLYIRTLEQAKAALDRLPKSGPFGFDIEWRPTYKKGAPENPVALVQLADDRRVLLFQVSCMRGIHLSVNLNRPYLIFLTDFPEELRQILENSRVVTAGVGIQGLLSFVSSLYFPSRTLRS